MSPPRPWEPRGQLDHSMTTPWSRIGAFTLEQGRLVLYPAMEPSAAEFGELTERQRRRILGRMKALAAVPEAAILDMLAWPHSGFSLNAEVRIAAHTREWQAPALRAAAGLVRQGFAGLGGLGSG